MKKSLLTILSAILVSTSIAQIPNFSFENWTSAGLYENPDNWGTMNNTTKYASVYTATKATPGNPGNFYLKLTSKTVSATVVNGIAVSGKLDSTTMQPKSGFAFNQRPASFTGKWQHMIYGTSQGGIMVTLTRWDTGLNSRVTVATAATTLSGMAMSWATFSLNFVYTDGGNPDTCIIVMKASGNVPTNNDYLWVDNLAFSGTVLGIEKNKNTLSGLSVFPNPSSENFTVEFNNAGSNNVKLELLDLTGKVVKEEILTNASGYNKYAYNTKGISKGIYFLRIISGQAIETKKIILN